MPHSGQVGKFASMAESKQYAGYAICETALANKAGNNVSKIEL
jgi:hypothetical protein